MLVYDENGVYATEFEDTYNNLLEDFKAVVSEDFVFSSSTPQAQMLGIFTKGLKDCEDGALFIANMQNPYSAVGKWLEQRVAYAGLLRKRDEKSIVEGVKFSGNSNTKIEKNTEFKDENNEVWLNKDEFVIGQDGQILVNLECKKAGEIDVKVGSSLIPVLLNKNIEKIEITQSAQLGALEESDGELLRRFMLSHAINNSEDALGIKAGLLALEGVKQVRVFEHFHPTFDENERLIYFDENGVPLHSINCVVLGGEDDEIAKVILKRKIGGCGLFGKVETKTFIRNEFRICFFDRPNILYPKLFLRLIRLKDRTDINVEQIKQNLSKTLFEIGENVYISRLYCVVNQTSGFDILEFSIENKSLFEVGTRDIAIILAQNIEVVVI